MSDIFSTLYKLKLNNSLNPLEDYLTEIFCYCLEEYEILRSDFLETFGIYSFSNEDELYFISTQHNLPSLPTHKSASRPDMVLIYKNATIFFENKVASNEGFEQLERYRDHLVNTETEYKTLVYIARDYEPKQIKNINFVEIRWFQVFNFLKKYKHLNPVFQMMLFMKNQKMAMNNKFTPTDLITLGNFSNVYRLMDETLTGEVTEMFKKINGSISRQDSCFTQLRRHDRYIYTAELKNQVWVGIGYWMNSQTDREYPEVGVIFEVRPTSDKRKEIINTFNIIKNLNESLWKSYSLDNPTGYAGIYKTKGLQEFLSDNSHIESIKDYLKIMISEIEQIYKDYEFLEINA